MYLILVRLRILSIPRFLRFHSCRCRPDLVTHTHTQFFGTGLLDSIKKCSKLKKERKKENPALFILRVFTFSHQLKKKKRPSQQGECDRNTSRTRTQKHRARYN